MVFVKTLAFSSLGKCLNSSRFDCTWSATSSNCWKQILLVQVHSCRKNWSAAGSRARAGTFSGSASDSEAWNMCALGTSTKISTVRYYLYVSGVVFFLHVSRCWYLPHALCKHFCALVCCLTSGCQKASQANFCKEKSKHHISPWIKIHTVLSHEDLGQWKRARPCILGCRFLGNALAGARALLQALRIGSRALHS